MNIIQAIVLGVVEGVTEFLPISSTFHLIMTSQLLRIPSTEFVKLFEVVVQSGAIFAAVFLYFQTLLHDFELMKKTAAAFLPTAVIGLVLHKIIKTVFFDSTGLMLTVFIVVGGVFFFIEYLIREKKVSLHKELKSFTYREAVIVGLCQALAVVPGVSRAGAVMVTMMVLGFRRDEAARFSFLLAIPTILAASALDLLKARDVLMASAGNIGLLVVGMVAAFISAYVVMRWFIGYLKGHTLEGFAWYRIVAGIIMMLLVASVA